jgi:MFS family permease
MLAGPAQVAGRLLHLAFGRVVPARRVGVIVMAGLPLSFLLFALSDRLPVLMLFAILFGFANGLVTVVRGSIVPAYFGRENLGKISGAMTGIALVARACAPFATAMLLTSLPGYRELLLVLGAVGVLALAAFAFATPPRRPSTPGPAILSPQPFKVSNDNLRP